jgi:catechol 2,3-dioxygenase-like lactoylglutathione lyase family enzyme
LTAPAALLGRFLEVSVHAPDVLASLQFYESLGFVQASTGDAWTHPYGVVTDGRLAIGLHQSGFEASSLTWVMPGLARHAAALEALGIELEFARIDEVSFNELGFLDPSGQQVTMLEARTFTPPNLAPTHETQLGYFEEFGIPTTDLETAAAFWDRLGLVAFEPERRPFGKVVLAGRDLNVAFYDLDLRAPVLTFSSPDMPGRIAQLRERGYTFVERLPRGLDAVENALLRAPEGTLFLLTTNRD